MNTLDLALPDAPAAFAPGETLRIQLGWELYPSPAELTLRLFWFTEGRGPRDIGIVREEIIEAPGSKGERIVEWRLPPGPPSCAGTYLSLHWAVEAFAPGGEPAASRRFILSPTRSVLHMSTEVRGADAERRGQG